MDKRCLSPIAATCQNGLMSEFPGPVRQPPHANPVAVPESAVDVARTTTPDADLPVWVNLDYDDGTQREVFGFALSWTDTHVFVQVPWEMDYFEGRKDVWVESSRVRRRQLNPRIR